MWKSKWNWTNHHKSLSFKEFVKLRAITSNWPFDPNKLSDQSSLILGNTFDTQIKFNRIVVIYFVTSKYFLKYYLNFPASLKHILHFLETALGQEIILYRFCQKCFHQLYKKLSKLLKVKSIFSIFSIQTTLKIEKKHWK